MSLQCIRFLFGPKFRYISMSIVVMAVLNSALRRDGTNKVFYFVSGRLNKVMGCTFSFFFGQEVRVSQY